MLEFVSICQSVSEWSVTHAAVYIWDSPSARWGLRPQAPIWVLAKFGDKRSSMGIRKGRCRNLFSARGRSGNVLSRKKVGQGKKSPGLE
ncbi:hypothetical protein J6590_064787 [Homalodisca vitripennis]|nr:hypothetical protein J6590_064787 [Homalodisca vitripennis]